MQFLEDHVGQVACFSTAAGFPASTFEEETIDVGTRLSKLHIITLILAVQDVCL